MKILDRTVVRLSTPAVQLGKAQRLAYLIAVTPPLEPRTVPLRVLASARLTPAQRQASLRRRRRHRERIIATAMVSRLNESVDVAGIES